MKLDNDWLELAQAYADDAAVCKKVKVGCALVKLSGEVFIGFGANRSVPDFCDGVACNKVLPYDGLPHCVSTIHAEIDAIIRAKRDLTGATAYVTRYPCENCARALVRAGVRKVVYGRPQQISDEVVKIFLSGNVEFLHIPTFNPEGE